MILICLLLGHNPAYAFTYNSKAHSRCLDCGRLYHTRIVWRPSYDLLKASEFAYARMQQKTIAEFYRPVTEPLPTLKPPPAENVLTFKPKAPHE